MDHKSWLWKKKSTEKSIVADDKANLSLNRNEDERLVNDKAELERDLRILNDKLSSALSECNDRDDFAKKQTKIAQEAIAGWEKEETKAISLKLELDKALQQRAASEERLIHLDAALKECMQQLRFVRDEQEKRIHDAVMKTSKEFERTKIGLDEKLAEATKRLSRADAESSQLSKALLAKEKVIEELNKHRTQVEADLNALMTRLESIDKENASLTYEVRVLEKELEIRNEEREFNRRTADVSHKQHLENVKKIAKLESECQRLRLLVRKRLPGPASLAKMKNEVEMLGRDQFKTRRKSNPSLIGSMDFSVDVTPDIPGNHINFLTEQLCSMEEENRTLKETLNKKTNELQSSRILYAQQASRLSQLEGNLGDHTVAEPGKILHPAHELSLASMSDLGSDDKTSCAESWASALISELELFKNGKQAAVASSRAVGASDMSLMDDFVEMEKLAVVSAGDSPSESSSHHNMKTKASNGDAPKATVPVLDPSDLSASYHQNESESTLGNKLPGWLEEILQAVSEKSQVSRRTPDEVLEEIKAALTHVSNPNSQSLNNRESSEHHEALCDPRNISQGSPYKSLEVDSSCRETGSNILTAKNINQKFKSNLRISIHKIIELIEGIGKQSLHHGNSDMLSRMDDRSLQYGNSETSTGYVVRVFQWKSSELAATLDQFVQGCNNLLNEKSDVEKFAQQLTCTLDWIMNHCFSLQDVSSMKDAIKNQFEWDDSRSESEVDSRTINHFLESNKMHVQGVELSPWPTVSAPNCHEDHFQGEEVYANGKREERSLRDESPNNESAEKDMEGRLQAEIVKSESLMIQLQKSCTTIESLRTEVETLKQLKEKTEDQSKKHKMVTEDLQMQLMNAKNELNEACKKLIYLEKELENKNISSEKLDATCHNLQLELESMEKKEIPDDTEHAGRQLRTDWEIAAASEKLAECQETILNLGKQLKALAPPTEAALFDKDFDKDIYSPADPSVTTIETPDKKVRRRSSLLHKMQAEDKAEIEDFKSPKTKEIILDGDRNTVFSTKKTSDSPERSVNHDDVVASLAIVPRKKRGVGRLLRKLLWKGEKRSRKKIIFS